MKRKNVIKVFFVTMMASADCVIAFTSTKTSSGLTHFSKHHLLKPPIRVVCRAVSVKSPAETRPSVDVSHAKDSTRTVPTTMPEAVNRFFLGPDRGPRIISIAISSMVIWRAIIGNVALLDVTAFSCSVVFWWFQEHFLHEKILHSERDWMGKEIHQSHHDNPYFHISIDPAPLMVGWLAVACLFLSVVLPAPVSISASIGYATAGMFYEWAHYIVHTRVKPPNAFWKRVRDHHIRHHRVDSNYWFGFSLPAIDDIFGTNPSVNDVRSRRKEGK